MSTASPTDSW